MNLLDSLLLPLGWLYSILGSVFLPTTFSCSVAKLLCLLAFLKMLCTFLLTCLHPPPGLARWGRAVSSGLKLFRSVAFRKLPPSLGLFPSVIKLLDWVILEIFSSSKFSDSHFNPAFKQTSDSQVIPRAKWSKFDGILWHLFCYPLHTFSLLWPYTEIGLLGFYEHLYQQKKLYPFFFFLSISESQNLCFYGNNLTWGPASNDSSILKVLLPKLSLDTKGSGFIWGHGTNF